MPGCTAGSVQSRMVRLLASCRDDPVRFATAVLGWDTPDLNALVSYQVEIARLVARHKTVVVPAGNSVGKSRLAACLIAWWLLTRPNSKVVVVAASQDLIGDVIFEELRKLHATARFPLGGEITTSPKASPQTWTLGPGWGAMGKSTTSVERGSGRHNPHLLVICDEASGIQDHAWEAIHSLKAAKLVVFGNPLRAEGEFVKLFEQSRKASELALPPEDRTVSLVVSSTDSPHARLKKSPCGLADAGFLAEMERIYRRDSPFWRFHIELDKDNPFPTTSHNQLIDTEWVDRCTRVSPPLVLTSRTFGMAVDVSKGTGRDATVIVVGDIYGVVHVHRTNTTEIREAARLVARLSREWGVDHQNIVYDAGGWAGSDMRKYLGDEAIHDARAYLGNGPGGPRYRNRRTQCACRLRERLDPDRTLGRGAPRPDPFAVGGPPPVQPSPVQPGFSIPMGDYWPQLRQELIGLRAGFEAGRTALENKEDFAARLKRSPDLCDALLMLCSIWQWPD